MRRFVISGLKNRRSRALALGLGVLVASVSFVLLTAAAKSNAIRVRGSVKSNYRAAYDIVVRPRGSATRLERSEGLVRGNYLSGVFGGITLKQWRTIQQIRGVDVAAPIANVGYMNLRGSVTVPLDRFLTREPYQIFRVTYRFFANNHSWSYPSETQYVYYTRVDRMTPYGGPNEIIQCKRDCAPFGYRVVHPCLALQSTTDTFTATPFSAPTIEACFSARSPGGGSDSSLFNSGQYRVGQVDAADQLQFPIFLAGIDPVQEARLLHLNRTIVSGRYLRANERPWIVSCHCNLKNNELHVPVIESAKTFIDERLVVRVSRLEIPRGTDVPDRLSNGFALDFVTHLKARALLRNSISAQVIYDHLLAQQGPGFHRGSQLYWTTSPVKYRASSTGVLRPRPVHNPLSVWSYFGGYWPSPIADSDTQYRLLHERNSRNSWTPPANVLRLPFPFIVGRYDPTRLPGFSPLSRVPLETYYPPILEPADASSKKALGGKPLMPTENVGDYIQQPPLLLTSIQGALPFLSSNFYTTNGNQDVRRGQITHAAAPIAAIRVRVHGVTGPDALSQARVDTVAQLIHDNTGLQVDITAGSSPHPLIVSLARSKLGRPGLLLREGWSKKGVAVSFVKALDQKDLALFALILVVGAFFVTNGALAAVKARRGEIGTLLTVGWSRGSIFGAVLAELALVGVVAGMLGLVLAVAMVELFSLRARIGETFLVLPTAAILTIGAGLIPAWLAARGSPLDALRAPVAASYRAFRARRVTALALMNVSRMPARTLVGAGGLVVGVGALTVLLAIQHAFQGTLVGTLLGHALSLQVRASDYLAAGLTIALAVLSIADVLFLNLRERAAEFVTLISLGWRDQHLAFMIAAEALVIGLASSLMGAAVGVSIGAGILGVPLGGAIVGASLAVGMGTLAALLASLVPLMQLARLTAPSVLASE